MKKAIFLIAFLSSAAWGYVDGTVLVLDTGTVSMKACNSGALGGCQNIALPTGSNQVAKVWFSYMGFPERGPESICHSPCSVSIDQELGSYAYFFEITSSTGVSLTPQRLSSRTLIQPVLYPATTTLITPAFVFGNQGMAKGYTFSVPGGTDVSNLRVWLWLQNTSNNKFSVWANNTPPRKLGFTPINYINCDGLGTCTIGTTVPHGLTTGATAQIQMLSAGSQSTAGSAQLNDLFPVTVTGPMTFTIFSTTPSAMASGDWGARSYPEGTDEGDAVQNNFYYADESKYFGGMRGNGRDLQVMVPLGATDITAGQNNVMWFGYNGAPYESPIFNHGQWILLWDVVQSDFEMSKLVASSTSITATATTLATHNFNIGDTVLLRDAPGPRWRFNGFRVITATTPTTFSFNFGPDPLEFGEVGSTTTTDTFYTSTGPFVVPTVNDQTVNHPAHMYACKCLIAQSSFTYYNPATFPSYGGNAANGLSVFTTSVTKVSNPYFSGHKSLASCMDCHIQNGWDLKFFNFHPEIIKVAALKRGLSDSDSNDIVAYIASLNVTTATKSRPWNPPFQPYVHADSDTIVNWRAGGGLEWVLTYDNDMREFLVPNSTYTTWGPSTAAVLGINPREIPTSFPLQYWIKWLPSVHPKDWFNAMGLDFTARTAWTSYNTYKADLSTTTLSTNYSVYVSSTNLFQEISNGSNDVFDILVNYLSIYDNTTSTAVFDPPNMYGIMANAFSLWRVSRLFELFTTYDLDHYLDAAFASSGFPIPNTRALRQYTRGWYTGAVFNTGPHESNIQCSVKDFLNYSGDATTVNHDFDTATWYHTQMIINAGDRLTEGNVQLDWPYTFGFQNSLSYYRPSMYNHMINVATNIQNTWGWTIPTNGISMMNLTAITMRLPVNIRFVDQMSTQPIVGELMGEVADQMYQVISTFTTTQWQTYFAGDCPSSGHTVPNAFNAWLGSGAFCDSVAMALPEFKYYSTLYGTPPAAKLATITTWANNVFGNALGYDFNVDLSTGGCAMDGELPPQLRCNNTYHQ